MTQVPAIPIPRRCEVSQKFFFDAAHTLKRTLDDADEVAGSRRIHGHTYHAEVTVAGNADADTGMVGPGPRDAGKPGRLYLARHGGGIQRPVAGACVARGHWRQLHPARLMPWHWP